MADFCRHTNIRNVGELGKGGLDHREGWQYIRRMYGIVENPWDFWRWLKSVKVPFDCFVHRASLKPDYDVETIRDDVARRVFGDDPNGMNDFLWVVQLKARLGKGVFED